MQCMGIHVSGCLLSATQLSDHFGNAGKPLNRKNEKISLTSFFFFLISSSSQTTSDAELTYREGALLLPLLK